MHRCMTGKYKSEQTAVRQVIAFHFQPQVVEETLPALQKLKEQGLIRFIGFTGLPLKIYRSVLDRCAQVACMLGAMCLIMVCEGLGSPVTCMCQLIHSVCLAVAMPSTDGQGGCLSCSLPFRDLHADSPKDSDAIGA